MNRDRYRLVFNELSNTWVPVAETVENWKWRYPVFELKVQPATLATKEAA